MKVGFTSIEQNIYGAKKRKNIGFKAANSIVTDKKSITNEKNSEEEAAKRKKMIIAGTVAAVAVPTTITVLAMLGAKSKKKVNAKSVIQIENEITNNDLLNSTQEIAKILKAYSSRKQISYNDAIKLTNVLDNYRKILENTIGNNIIQAIFGDLCKITNILNEYIKEEKNNEKKKDLSTSNNGLQESLKTFANNIKILNNILSRNNDIASVKRILEGMMRRRINQKEEIPTSEGKQTIRLNESSQIKNNIVSKLNIDKLQDKAFQDVRYAQDSDGKPYLIFNKTSDIGKDNKQISGFKIPGMGETRFVAVSLDGLSLNDVTKFVKNDDIKEQLIADDISDEAKTYMQSLLEKSSKLEVIGLIKDAPIDNDNKLIEDYIDKKIESFEIEKGEKANTKLMKELVDDQYTLKLLASSKRLLDERISKCINCVEYDVVTNGYKLIEDDKSKTDVNSYKVFQELTKKLQETYSENYPSIVDKCKNFICLTNLKYSKPQSLMDNYAKLIETNKNQIDKLQENESLFIHTNGETETSTNNNQFNIAYTISLLSDKENNNKKIVVKNAYDEEITYIQDDATKAGELQFKSSYKDKLNYLKDAYDIQNILGYNIGLDTTVLYSLKDMTYGLIDKYKKVKKDAQLNIQLVQSEENRTSIPDDKSYASNVLHAVDNVDDISNLVSELKQIYKQIDTFVNKKVTKDEINEFIKSFNFKEDLYLESSYDNNSFSKLIDSNIPIKEGDSQESYIMAQLAVNKLNVNKKTYKTLFDLNGNKLDKQVRLERNDNNADGTIQSSVFYLDDDTIYKFESDGKNGYKIDEKTKDGAHTPSKYHFVNKAASVEAKGGISENKEVESILFSILDRPAKKKYLEFKIRDAISKNPLWADEAENVIHTMYFCNLLEAKFSNSTKDDNDKGKQKKVENEPPQQTARQIYENYLYEQEPGILYINKNGIVSGLFSEGAYKLTLG